MIKSDDEESSEIDVVDASNMRVSQIVKSSQNLTAMQQNEGRLVTQAKYAIKVMGNNQLFLYQLTI